MATSQFVSSITALQMMANTMQEQQRELEIHRQQINYVERSNVDVQVDRRFNTVSIADVADPLGGFFLDGDDADTFIDQADEIFEKGTFPMVDCYKIVAYSYVDALV
jgi:murein endopeptidase